MAALTQIMLVEFIDLLGGIHLEWLFILQMTVFYMPQITTRIDFINLLLTQVKMPIHQ